jgi:hypothetical protein
MPGRTSSSTPTKAIVVGPFERQSHALGVAHPVACRRGGCVLDGLHHEGPTS